MIAKSAFASEGAASFGGTAFAARQAEAGGAREGWR
jgi:hypothetical protein